MKKPEIHKNYWWSTVHKNDWIVENNIADISFFKTFRDAFFNKIIICKAKDKQKRADYLTSYDFLNCSEKNYLEKKRVV